MKTVFIYTTPCCTVCGSATELVLDASKYLAWRDGEKVQNAFPDFNADQRELLISGIHADCWEELTGEEE